MNIYMYDAATREYTGAETAQLDPLETKVQGKDVYLLPANATFTPIPPTAEGYVAVYQGNDTWQLVEDNRGVEHWLSDDKYGTPARIMSELGALPQGAVLTQPQKTFNELKAERLTELKQAFVVRRDAIRWVEVGEHKYGFDTESHDITNFMAAWKAAEASGRTLYKVWLPEGEKGLVDLTNEDFQTVFNKVRQSQYKDYSWYEMQKHVILNCKTPEDLIDINIDCDLN